MKCTYCKSEIGNIKETWVCFCDLSKIKIGMMLVDDKNEVRAWVSDRGMVCKSCRPSNTYTNIHWTLPKENSNG